MENLQTKPKKIRLLAYCDSPVCFSGFGQVARNILGELYKTGKFEITVWGINHHFEVDEFGRFIKPAVPYEILPAAYVSPEDEKQGFKTDMFGREKLAKYMFENEFDIFWSVQDPYVVQDFVDKLINLKTRMNRNFRSIFYFPVDAANISHRWAETPKFFDRPVVYTEFGKREVLKKCPELKDRLEVINHGTNTKDFYPLNGEQKKNIRASLRIPEDACVVLNVNRNQGRKDLARTLEAYAGFKKKVPNSILFLFCKENDIGGSIKNRAKYYGLEDGDIIFPKLPTGKDAFKGAPIEEVNQAYNIANMCVSTTLGEGWGLSITEAMGCKVPVIFPNNSSLTEIIGINEERGFLVDSGVGPSCHIQLPELVDDPPRPLTDVDQMVEKMLYVWENKSKPEVLDKVSAAYDWVLQNTWEKIVKEQWLPIFEKTYEEIQNSKNIT